MGLGSSDVEPSLGDLQQTGLQGIGGYHRTVQGYSAILRAKFAGADLKIISGYGINAAHDSFNFGYAVGDDMDFCDP